MGALRNTSLYFEAPDRAFTSETPPVEVVAFMESGSSFFLLSDHRAEGGGPFEEGPVGHVQM